MASASAMYHTGYNPLRSLKAKEPVHVVKDLEQRRLHKAFLRYHDPNNWPMLREALRRMGREDLIGGGKHHLVPSWQPAGTGDRREGARGMGGRHAGGGDRVSAQRPQRPRPGAAYTQHSGLPPQPGSPRKPKRP
jgi:hypothetical protein